MSIDPQRGLILIWMVQHAGCPKPDSNYLHTAESCVRFLQSRKANPYYEVLLPFGALTAARLNAEHQRRYDVDPLLNWRFGISDCRGGWGDYDCDGLVGSIDNRGGSTPLEPDRTVCITVV